MQHNLLLVSSTSDSLLESRLSCLFVCIAVSYFTKNLGCIWSLIFSLSIMDTCDDNAELLNCACNYGISTRGSFLSPNYVGRLAVMPNIANSVFHHIDYAVKAGVDVRQGLEKDWNVAIVLCADGSSGLEDGLFYGSGPPDRVACTFGLIDWDSLQLSWKHSNGTVILSWTYRPATVRARRHSDRGLAPRPFVQIRASTNEPNISLLKRFSKREVEKQRRIWYQHRRPIGTFL